jgi:hypothetical protein
MHLWPAFTNIRMLFVSVRKFRVGIRAKLGGDDKPRLELGYIESMVVSKFVKNLEGSGVDTFITYSLQKDANFLWCNRKGVITVNGSE